MPQELQNLLITLNIVFALMFLIVTIIIIIAYRYEMKETRKYEQLTKQLIVGGKYEHWKIENKTLLLIEKYSLWLLVLVLIFSGIITLSFHLDDQATSSTSEIIYRIILVILTVINIFTKRLLRKK